MKTLNIVPVKGRLILMPEQGYKRLDEPATVVASQFYYRALRDGDIALAPAAAPVAPPAAAPAAPQTPITAIK